VLERVAALRTPGTTASVERAALGSLDASWDVCPPGCCANPRGPLPALCGLD
jgi:protoporphyrin/coproporphyrin ferrochelatase